MRVRGAADGEDSTADRSQHGSASAGRRGIARGGTADQSRRGSSRYGSRRHGSQRRAPRSPVVSRSVARVAVSGMPIVDDGPPDGTVPAARPAGRFADRPVPLRPALLLRHRPTASSCLRTRLAPLRKDDEPPFRRPLASGCRHTLRRRPECETADAIVDTESAPTRTPSAERRHTRHTFDIGTTGKRALDTGESRLDSVQERGGGRLVGGPAGTARNSGSDGRGTTQTTQILRDRDTAEIQRACRKAASKEQHRFHPFRNVPGIGD